MASGTPVISTADGGQGEFMRNGQNALIFPKEDSGALAACLIRLMDDPALARRLAEEGRRTVVEGFTLTGYVAQLEAFLQNGMNQTKESRLK
jgi:glycosyltransferase involved in cell wall biosynthesis